MSQDLFDVFVRTAETQRQVSRPVQLLAARSSIKGLLERGRSQVSADSGTLELTQQNITQLHLHLE